MLAALDAGAEDVNEAGTEMLVYTEPKQLAKVRDTLKAKNFSIAEAELTYVPNNTIIIDNAETAAKIERLLDALDELQDVISTHVNFDVPDEVADKT